MKNKKINLILFSFMLSIILYSIFLYAYGELSSGDYVFVFKKTYLFLLASFILLIIYIVLNLKNKRFKNTQKENKRLPIISYEEKLNILKYKDLTDKTIHLYFSNNFLNRIEIYQNIYGSYSYSIESLDLFDDDELCYASEYGHWFSIDSQTTYYHDIKSIKEELKNILKSYTEDTYYIIKN